MPPWFQIIRYVVEFFLFAVQVTLVYLVVRQQRRRIHNYGSGFFDVFVCKTLIEIAEFSAAFLYLRVPAMGAIPKDSISPELIKSYFVLNCFLMYGQEMCHALIAADRYVIFRYPTEKV
ncbi:hypothetical protein AAVH_31548 [Aphelenchoides avenae]|nr:hypothetical protein AAVH_31548 [Aphelenchus avenae]